MPEEPNQVDTKNSRRDGLALILGGIFILGLVFATYTYFNREITSQGDLSSEETSALDKLKDIISSKTERKDDTQKEDKTTPSNADDNAPKVAGASTTSTQWMATDYKLGDLQPGSYTVRQGDTLWEIAEAVYGDGTQWTKILNANVSSIGFLPNGSQALIVTGQVLAIPTP